MSAAVLDGKAVAAEVVGALSGRIARLSRPPGLVVVLVGDDPASAVYVRNKARAAEKLGMHHREVVLPGDTPEADVVRVVRELNTDPLVDGILIQLPLPRHIDKDRVLDLIDPAKDVDGFHPYNVGLLSQRRAAVVACTPAGVMELLARTGIALAGKDAIVVGRSNIVGKPMVQLLEQVDCTVTLAHSRTRDLPGHVRRADVVVAAVGVPDMVKGEWIRDGAIVIDVGINRRPDGKLTGDVEYAAAAERASWITPVPGGVGPMTIAMLMSNTVRSAERRLAVA